MKEEQQYAVMLPDGTVRTTRRKSPVTVAIVEVHDPADKAAQCLNNAAYWRERAANAGDDRKADVYALRAENCEIDAERWNARPVRYVVQGLCRNAEHATEKIQREVYSNAILVPVTKIGA